MTPTDGATRCENCGRAAGPRFCPHCGQEVEARIGPLRKVVREAMSDWLSLDSRLMRSLRALAVPGRLSELYLSGKRAPFLRPFRLYLLASLVLFSTLLALEAPDATGVEVIIAGVPVAPEASEGPAGAAETAERGDREPPGEPAADRKARSNVTRKIELFENRTLLGRWRNELFADRIDRVRRLPRQEIVRLLASGFRRTLPSTLILFVPLLALGLKLLYIRGRAARSLYIDHLVFSMHFQTALFLALSAAWLVARVTRLELGPSAIAYVGTALSMLVVYLPLALKRFYRQSWGRTAVKAVILFFAYFQLLTPVIVISELVAFRDV